MTQMTLFFLIGIGIGCIIGWKVRGLFVRKTKPQLKYQW